MMLSSALNMEAGEGMLPSTFGAGATPATAHFRHPVPPQVNARAPDHNVPNANVGGWSTSLCGCFKDKSNCLITFVCPCITFGQNAEIIDQGNISCMRAGYLCCLICHISACSFCYTCTYRTKLRGLHAIPGNQCGDCFLHLCCQPCALCQEYRELKNQGFNPSIGWVANQVRRTQQVRTMDPPPSVPGSMIRWRISRANLPFQKRRKT